MKRDMELVRRILMEIEASPEANGIRHVGLNFEGHSVPEVMYHAKLLVKAGLIEARGSLGTMSGLQVYPTGLTWQGHEFLDAIRKDTLWERTKSIAIEATGGLSLEALKAAAILAVHQAVSAMTR